jgi:ketosteroid isomerase-like protein
LSDRIELVRGSLEAFMRGDLEAALTPASEDVVSVRAAPLPIRRRTTAPTA